MAAEIRVALLGYGLAGRQFHAPLISAEPRMTIHSIVTSNPDRRDQAIAHHPDARIFSTAEEVWANSSDVDLVVIATANAAHVPQARAALESGLTVIVDKPLAATADEALELISLAEARGRPLHVFLNRRWDSEFLTAKQAIDERLLGDVHRLESRFDRWRPERKGGWRETGGPEQMPGLLFDLGSHLIDQAIALMGPVHRVAASLRTVRQGVVGDDDTQVLLWHTAGGVSQLSMSAMTPFTEPRLRLLGTSGGLEIPHLDGQEDALKAGIPADHTDWGTESADAPAWIVTGPDPTPRLFPRQRGRWPAFYAGVARSMIEGAPAPVNARDAVEDLRVIEAAQRASREGRTVELDPPAGHITPAG